MLTDDNQILMYPEKGRLSKYNLVKWKFMLDADFDVSEQCCDVMKKKPARQYEKETKRKPIIGTMAVESRARGLAWTKTGCNAFEGARKHSMPMSFWTEQDVLRYIIKYDLPYCSVYGEIVEDENGKLKTTGTERTGCMFCGFGAHLDKHPTRFERLKETHPKQYNYCINGGAYDEDGKWKPSKEGLGLGHVFDYMGVEYGKEE